MFCFVPLDSRMCVRVTVAHESDATVSFERAILPMQGRSCYRIRKFSVPLFPTPKRPLIRIPQTGLLRLTSTECSSWAQFIVSRPTGKQMSTCTSSWPVLGPDNQGANIVGKRKGSPNGKSKRNEKPHPPSATTQAEAKRANWRPICLQGFPRISSLFSARLFWGEFCSFLVGAAKNKNAPEGTSLWETGILKARSPNGFSPSQRRPGCPRLSGK